MTSQETLITMLCELFGSSFVSIKGYMSATTQELANHLINANVSYTNSAKKDLVLLQSAKFDDEIMEMARLKKIDSLIKNSDDSTRNNYSKGQIEAYDRINDCSKIKKDTKELFFHGMAISKTVLESAKTPKKKSENPMVLAGLKIDKILNLSTPKYRQFKFSLLDIVKISGTALVLKNVSIVAMQ